MASKQSLTERLVAASWRSSWSAALVAAGLSLAGAAQAASVDAMNLFELDRNAVNDAAAGDDADQIFCDDQVAAHPCKATTSPSSALYSVFVADKVNSTEDDVVGGKDSLDINQWTHTVKSAGDKVDIGNAFASIYTFLNPDTNKEESILYVGLDKFSNNGDAAIGFWILQNDLVKNLNGTFSAVHKDGDVLIQADLTSGGRLGRYDVYTWGPNPLLNTPVAPSQGDLTLAIDSTNCGVGASPDACGVVNAGGETAPWPYTPKSGPAGKFPANSYFEGGVNLTKIFPEGIPCVATFLAETRQSQSETAELGDFALGKFALCGFSITKTGPELSKPGDTVTYTVTITNDGAVALENKSIVDSLVGDVTSSCPATLNPGQVCQFTYPYTIPANAGTVADLGNTVTATFGVNETEVTHSATHDVNLFKPSVALDKKANNSNGPLTIKQGDNLTYTIAVSNTSTSDTPSLTCVVTDPQLNYTSAPFNLGDGGSTLITLDQGAQTTPFTNKVNTASVSCSPAGFPNVVTASDSVTVTVTPLEITFTVEKFADAYSKSGDALNYSIVITNTTADQTLTFTSIDDPLLGGSLLAECPASLAPGASCTINKSRTTQAGDPNPLVNTVTVGVTNQFGTADSKADSASTGIVAPNLAITKDCLSGDIFPGDTASFRIRVQNTGNVPLEVDVVDNLLGVNQQDVALGTGNCVFDGDASDGCLEIEGSVVAGDGDVSNTASATGTLAGIYGLNNVISKNATATCKVQQKGGATRTLGFWKSHGSDGDRFAPPVEYGYTCHVAEEHVGFPIAISKTAGGTGVKVLHYCSDVFGLFWSSPAKLPNGAKRPALCQTKLHASWQLMAAILNSGLDNGATPPIDPVSGLSAIEAMKRALNTDDKANIVRLQGILGNYNQSGDSQSIIDTDGAPIPSADPNGTRDEANLAAGSCNF
ncbi:MAG TPA: hypothetical protein VJM11_17925 [Nevskiaceae bacterium]|nr:hypothetical protein [Nevskiaceae bacterium]